MTGCGVAVQLVDQLGAAPASIWLIIAVSSGLVAALNLQRAVDSFHLVVCADSFSEASLQVPHSCCTCYRRLPLTGLRMPRWTLGRRRS